MFGVAISSITLRTIYALVTAFLIVIAVGPWVISRLKEKKIGQHVREEGVQAHLKKSGVPTMGGIMIIVAVLVSTVVWGKASWVLIYGLSTFLFMGLIGCADDFLKLKRGKSNGLSARQKLLAQFLWGIGSTAWLYSENLVASTLFVPGPGIQVELGAWWIVLASVAIVGYCNAVNLTDGLDGLAAGIMFIVIACMGLLAYLSGNSIYSKHLGIPHIQQAGELTVLCFATAGACLGFLWYNCRPASVFMGDTGSLALGGLLGAVGVMVKAEIFMLVVGGIFVLEALSVMLQVGSFKTTGKRIFRMAPIHHHFELMGWDEIKVVVRFWIVTLVLSLIGLSLLGLNGRIFIGT